MINLRFLQSFEVGPILSQEDDYLRNINPFSLQIMQCRSRADYQRILAQVGMNFSQSEINRISRFAESINQKLQTLNLTFNLDITIAKTSGQESMGMPYTRHSTIVLTAAYLQAQQMGMKIPNVDMGEGLLAHEIFHVISRLNPHLREELYSLHNFRFEPLLEEIPNIITNPDAPNSDYVTTVEYNRQEKTARPVLAVIGQGMSAMMSADKQLFIDGRFVTQNQTTYLQSIQATSAFSTYHPEEICAEDFRLLLEGRNFPTKQAFMSILRSLN